MRRVAWFKARAAQAACVGACVACVACVVDCSKVPPSPAPSLLSPPSLRSLLSIPLQGASAAMESPEVAPPLQVSRVERDGVRISFELRPLSAADGQVEAKSGARAVLTITDAATGAPVRGREPLAWMSKRREPSAPDEEGCREKVKSFSAGLLSVKADVDMNAYLVWALNRDATISVINPLIAFRRTKLMSLLELPGEPGDWVAHPGGGRVYVTIPERDEVAVLDTTDGRVVAKVASGDAPGRVAVAPDGRLAWVGNDGESSVTAIDTRSSTAAGTVHTGAGRHAIAFTDGGRTAWVTGSAASEVTVIDAERLEVDEKVEVGEGAAAIAASDAAGAVYVANETAGEIVVIDARTRAIAKRIAIGPGLAAVSIDPSGRFVFATRRGAGEVAIIDTATATVAHTLSGFTEPDAMTFTSGFAYVRQRGTNTVSMIELNTLNGVGTPAVVTFQAGQRPPGDVGIAAPIAPLPDGRSVIVANPAEKALYLYVEGMMAPLGTLQNYGREPSAALVVDRKLREVSPGVYETAVRVPSKGLYDVEVLLDRPRVAACLEHTITGAPSQEEEVTAPRFALEPLFDPEVRLAVGEPAALPFRIRDSGSIEPVREGEVEAVIVRFPGTWQNRPAVRSLGAGHFEVTLTPPRTGQYRLFAGVPSRGAARGVLPFFTLHAVEKAGGEMSLDDSSKEGKGR